MKTSRLLALMALLAPLFLVGCGGGGRTTVQNTSTQTLGKQLLDLDQAYKTGAIDKEDYEKARKKLINDYPYK